MGSTAEALNDIIAVTATRQTRKRITSKPKTIGFGCPVTIAPHRFVVAIPRGTRNQVVITEDLGAQGEYTDQPAEIERIVLERSRWTPIANEVKRVFNQRLKERGLAVGRWKVGDNHVDRLLGKELMVLAWAIEHAESAEIPVAVRNWLALRPEERWWLYGMAAASTGGVDDGHSGWRLALRNALAESRHGVAAAIKPERKDAMAEQHPLPLPQKQK